MLCRVDAILPFHMRRYAMPPRRRCFAAATIAGGATAAARHVVCYGIPRRLLEI